MLTDTWFRSIMLAILVIPAILFLLALYFLILSPYFFSPLRHIPGPPLGNPITGQFPAIITGEAGIPQREWVKKYGSAVRVVGPIGIERVIFTRPEAMAKILVSDWIDYPRPDFMRHALGITAGYGLLTVTGNEHKNMRKAMNPAFSIPNLTAQTSMYYDSIYTLIDILRKQLDGGPHPEQGQVILTYDWMSKVTLDIICATAFGYKSDSLNDSHNELAEAYEALLGQQSGPHLARFIALLSIPGVPTLITSNWAYRHRQGLGMIPRLGPITILIDSMHRIKAISRKILQEKLSENVIPGDTDSRRDIMSLLLKARKAESASLSPEKFSPSTGTGGYQMSDDMIMNQVLTFLGAGHETTASGLAWTLYLLATSPDVQRKLREEVSEVFNPEVGDGRPDYRVLKDLEWLDCVIMESLRLYPPVPMSFRKAAKTDYVDGVLIPEGTILYIPIRVINTWKVIWGEDAEEFRPSRWLNLPAAYHSTFSFLTFLAGPHACIGKTMSIIEMKAVIGALVANFDFTPAYEGQLPKPTAAVTMKPADNMPLRMRRVR
ncbi:cytochrome P450 [Mycena floridula]|nr:cytochrome P450 [Mycena floridula]